MSDKKTPVDFKKLNFRDPAFWVATWFGSGLMKPAPGTWGSLAALPFGILMMVYGGWPVLLFAAAAAFAAGLWAAGRFEKTTGIHDSGIVVIDEVAGLWLTLITAAVTPLSVVLAFLLFRFFDMLKPWPISWFDRRLKGPWGVMVDDIVAALASMLVLWSLRTYAGIG